MSRAHERSAPPRIGRAETRGFEGARFLFVSSSYPFHREDFHALFVHEMAKALVGRGAHVRVLTPQTPEGGAAVEVWEGVEVRRFGYPGLSVLPLTGGEGMLENARARPLKVLSAPGLMASFFRATRRAVREAPPNVVVTHWLVPTGLAVSLALLRSLTRCPVLHVAHSSDVHLLARLPVGRALCRAISSSGPVLATSEALAARLRSARLVDDPIVWRLPLQLPPEPPPRTSSHSSLRVVAMSRLIEGKGLLTLVRAAALVPSVELRVAGAGPLADRLDDEIRALHVEDRVQLVGAVLGDAKDALLASGDVFAFVPEPRTGSFEDNLPISVLEGMAHGLPVLATRVGNLPELLARRGGGVLTGADVASVARALEALAAEDRSELSQRARETAEGFSVTTSLQALESVLASLPPRRARAC